MNVYFSDIFRIDSRIIKEYGALNISLINDLPPEQREQYRQSVGAFMHDMKHTLGLIVNANELVRREIKGCQKEHKAIEMIDIIKTGRIFL